ncbi:MAG: AidA/PixA family protein [Cyclobacteriaceae bacterium]
MANINVLVVVDTQNITQDNLSQTVVLVDDNLDTDSKAGDSETFTIHAKAGDNVRFRITSVGNNTEVIFNEFQWENTEGSQHCFNPMPEFSNSWTGLTVGEPGEHEDFYIIFSVGGEPHRKSIYKLDPKLKVMQSGGGDE